MRLARLAAVLFILTNVAHADVLHRVVFAQAGGGSAPTPTPTAPTPTAPSQPATPTPTPATGAPAIPGQPQPVAVGDLSAWAGSSTETGLPGLLETSIANVPVLAGATIDIAIAEARIQQTRSRDNWRVQSALNAGRTTGFVGGLALTRNTFVTMSVDVSRNVSTGGTLIFHAQGQWTQSTSNSDLIGDQTTWYDEIFVQFNQPLLRNRGRYLYEANQRRAELARDSAALAKRLAAIQQVQAVVSAYWDLVLAERQVAISQQSLALARERLRVTQIGTDGGKVPRSEIPAVQQIIATREEEVLSGELAVLDRSITLRRAAGMPIGAGELGLRVTQDLGIDDTTWDLGQLIENAYAASPELAQLAKQDASATIDIEVTENGLLPRLDAAITVGPTGQAEKLGTALEQTVKLDAMTYIGTLTLDHDLGNDDVRGLARENKEQKRRLSVNAQDIKYQIATAMARAVAQLELARRRVELSRRAIELANENIKIESDRFNLGKATNFDVLNRQEDLRQAELRQAQAMIDWHKAETTVQALTGDILTLNGIDLK